MTTKEAIEFLREVARPIIDEDYGFKDSCEAIDMAIEALQKQSMYTELNDSYYQKGREDAIDYLVYNGYIKYGFDKEYLLNEMNKAQMKEQKNE